MNGFRISTHPDVYPPAEDTDLLLQAIDGWGRDLAGLRALEMGPGTGLAALTLAARGATVLAVDVNPHACGLTRENARTNGLHERVQVVRGDLWGPVRDRARFDRIVFNPPYLPAEPEDHVQGWMDQALHGGASGLDVTTRFLAGLPHHLAPGGRALLLLSELADLSGLPAIAATGGLTWHEVATARFFFERLLVVELTQAGPRSPPL